MGFQKLFNKAVASPRQLFIINGEGALISAFFLGIVLSGKESVFGIPPTALYLLASIPSVIVAYDLFNYFQITLKRGNLLKGITILNMLYCFLSIIVAAYHIESISQLGWAFIIFEILIIVFFVAMELKTAHRLN